MPAYQSGWIQSLIPTETLAVLTTGQKLGHELLPILPAVANSPVIVLLKISGNKERTAECMAAHKAWLQQGFDDGVFLASGNLAGQPGGGIVVHGLSQAEVQQRFSQDPLAFGLTQLLALTQDAQRIPQLTPWRLGRPMTAGQVRMGLAKIIVKVDVRACWNPKSRKFDFENPFRPPPNAEKRPNVA